MKKLFCVLLMVALMGIPCFATETDLATQTDLVTQTDIVPAVVTETDATPTDIGEVIGDIVDAYVDIGTDVHSGVLPTEAELMALLQSLQEKIAAIDVSDMGDVGQYIKDEIIPIIFIVVSSVVTIYGMVLPIVLKAKEAKARMEAAANQFSGAAADVQEAIAEKKAVTEMQNEITALKEASQNMVDVIRQLKTENEGLTAEVKALSGPVGDELTKIKEAIKIGMCNTQELVNNGFAAKMIKTLDGEQNAETETETDSN